MKKKTIRVFTPIYRGGKLWINSGSYPIIKEFDQARWLVRLSEQTITLVDKDEVSAY